MTDLTKTDAPSSQSQGTILKQTEILSHANENILSITIDTSKLTDNTYKIIDDNHVIGYLTKNNAINLNIDKQYNQINLAGNFATQKLEIVTTSPLIFNASLKANDVSIDSPELRINSLLKCNGSVKLNVPSTVVVNNKITANNVDIGRHAKYQTK